LGLDRVAGAISIISISALMVALDQQDGCWCGSHAWRAPSRTPRGAIQTATVVKACRAANRKLYLLVVLGYACIARDCAAALLPCLL